MISRPETSNISNQSEMKRVAILIAGDIVILGVVTIFGFATHGTVGSAGMRMLSTFIPLVIAWLLLAPHLKVFDMAVARDMRRLWRPFWAMVLAAPMAAWLRGAWLNAPILPVFVVVLGGFSALALLAWRTVYCIASRSKPESHG